MVTPAVRKLYSNQLRPALTTALSGTVSRTDFITVSTDATETEHVTATGKTFAHIFLLRPLRNSWQSTRPCLQQTSS